MSGAPPPAPATRRVALLNTGQEFFCREDEFILRALLKAGNSPLRTGCCGGGCGVCKARVAGGRVHIAKPMSRAHLSLLEEKQGLVLLCCVQPRSDVAVEIMPPPNTP